MVQIAVYVARPKLIVDICDLDFRKVVLMPCCFYYEFEKRFDQMFEMISTRKYIQRGYSKMLFHCAFIGIGLRLYQHTAKKIVERQLNVKIVF